MRLRPADPTDVALLRYWDAKPHVASASGADGGFDWESELSRSPDWRELLIAESDGRPIGFIQIIDPAREETNYWGEAEADLRAIDIWIGEEADLGRGYGTVMMRLALKRCFADPAVKAILLDPLASNTRAHRFYERFGFKPVGRRRFGGDDCIVYLLERQAWHSAVGCRS
jgi:aminoglycoside 6'-N-acetyltransferase